MRLEARQKIEAMMLGLLLTNRGTGKRFRKMFLDGYGVEDAALKFGVPLDVAREAVAIMRERGTIERMFTQKRDWSDHLRALRIMGVGNAD